MSNKSHQLPSDWELTRLSDLAEVKGGKRLPKGHTYSPDRTQFRYLRVKDFFERDVNFDALEYLHEETFFKLENYEIRAGDLFISIAGSLGYVGVYRPPGSFRTILTENAARIESNSGVLPEFLARQLNSDFVQRQVFRLKGTGGGVPKLALFRIRGLAVPVPPLPQQRRIANILDTIDRAIRNTEEVIAKLEQMKRGLLHDLLTRGIDENGELRDPVAHPEQFKETELGLIPREWEVVELEHVTASCTYGFTNPMPESHAGPWMITAANIRQGQIDFSSARHTSEHAYNQELTEKSRPQFGDVLITKDGSLGRVARVPGGVGDICVNQSVAVIRPLPERINSRFLANLLQAPKYQERILSRAGGSTIKHLYVTRLRREKLALPQPAEQERLVSALFAFYETVEQEARQMEQLRELKAGLSSDLLLGTRQ